MYLNVNITTDLKHPGEEVWHVLKDFGGHYQFNPLIELSPITNGIAEGLGAERLITMYDGSEMLQTILDYEEGRSMLIGFTETSLPINHGTARFTLDPADQDFCRLAVDVQFEPKGGRLGGVLAVIYKPTIRHRYNLIVRGLKHFVATGQAVGQRVP